MENNKQTFSYTYSASQQDEVKKIRKKYLPETEDKMEILRKLDRSVTQKGTVAGLIFGVVGMLLMGFGMSLVMTDISETLGMSEPLVLGIVIGILGIAIAAIAYPMYKKITKRAREKLAPEILRLTDELLK